MTGSKYISWLEKNGTTLFRGAGTSWVIYNGALIPALPFPGYYHVDSGEVLSLLKASRAWLIRYSSTPCNYETSWWYIVCDHYDPKRITAKTRQNIRRGRRECTVDEVEAKWLADNGYPCYLAAFERYQNQKPIPENDFRKKIIDTCGGPFSYWGVFHEGHLAGYCQCIVDGKNATTNVTKYHPAFLRHRSAFALIDHLIQTYVVRNGMTLSNGNRSIAHNTNYQEVLISLGFRKQFCQLNIFYERWLQLGIKAMYPLRHVLEKLPDRHVLHKIMSLMRQEEIQRSFDNVR
ncbi:MAG: hypothetical protein M0018_04145 [Nitrospiraceae bacterium]|nr:hypothetical protein [Nitrospiraceae bacterium]